MRKVDSLTLSPQQSSLRMYRNHNFTKHFLRTRGCRPQLHYLRRKKNCYWGGGGGGARARRRRGCDKCSAWGTKLGWVGQHYSFALATTALTVSHITSCQHYFQPLYCLSVPNVTWHMRYSEHQYWLGIGCLLWDLSNLFSRMLNLPAGSAHNFDVWREEEHFPNLISLVRRERKRQEGPLPRTTGAPHA